jgi:hypothetical protein
MVTEFLHYDKLEFMNNSTNKNLYDYLKQVLNKYEKDFNNIKYIIKERTEWNEKDGYIELNEFIEYIKTLNYCPCDNKSSIIHPSVTIVGDNFIIKFMYDDENGTHGAIFYSLGKLNNKLKNLNDILY